MAGVNLNELYSKRPLIFAHIVLTKTFSVSRAREIRARITRRIDLWERGHHAGLVGDAEAKGADRKGRAAFSSKEEDDAVARSFHGTVLLEKLRQAIRRATDREGGGVSSSMTNALKPGDWVQRSSGRSTPTCVTPNGKSRVRIL